MQIDVIVPTYNRARSLTKALDSVLNQTFKDLNLIVVDDGSTDDTLSVLDRYKHLKNVYIYTQDNNGVSSARNLGVKKSQSPWISFLDSDDGWLPEKLELQMSFLQNNPKLRFLHSEEIWVRNGIRVNPKIKHQKSNENIFFRSLDFCLISPSTVVMRRDLFNECGPFDESFLVCEDYDLWIKILAKESIGFLSNYVTIKNGGHDDQLSTKYVAMDYWRIKSLANLIQKEKNLSPEQLIQIKSVLDKKSEVLLRGYIKHKNLDAYNEITSLLNSLIIYF